LVDGIHPILNTFHRVRQDIPIENIINRFQDKFQMILDLAEKVEQAAFEGITSQDCRLLYVYPGVSFDEATMENVNEDTKGRRRKGGRDEDTKDLPKPVLCTTSLGLLRDDIEFVEGQQRHKRVVPILPVQVSLLDVLNPN
jgi:hypothetical protein